MEDWLIWESDTDCQIIPDGEETTHYFDVKCGCQPKVENIDGKVYITHNSFEGREIFEMCMNSPFHTLRQRYDC